MQENFAEQLRSIRRGIVEQGNRNSHWQVGHALNAIRSVLLESLSTDRKALLQNIMSPIDINDDDRGKFTVAGQDALRLCDQLLSLCSQEERPRGTTQEDSTGNDKSVEHVIPSTQRVFIIHGHDATNTLRLRNLLKERFHIEPVVLAERPSKGRALIEKFEEEAADASYAFALVTPDDLIRLENREYAQARPNVAFELGWFYGRLGRQRVCILFREGSTLHSDLDGVLRIQFRESVEEKIGEIEKELRAAGLAEG